MRALTWPVGHRCSIQYVSEPPKREINKPAQPFSHFSTDAGSIHSPDEQAGASIDNAGFSKTDAPNRRAIRRCPKLPRRHKPQRPDRQP